MAKTEYQVFGAALRRLLGSEHWSPVWEPGKPRQQGGKGISRLGEYGKMDGGEFHRYGHIDEMIDRGYRTVSSVVANTAYWHSDGASVTVFGAGAAVQGAIGGRVAVSFAKKYGAWIARSGVTDCEIGSLDKLRSTLLGKTAWGREYVLVWRVHEAETIHVAVSTMRNTKFELNGSASDIDALRKGTSVSGKLSFLGSQAGLYYNQGASGPYACRLCRFERRRNRSRMRHERGLVSSLSVQDEYEDRTFHICSPSDEEIDAEF